MPTMRAGSRGSAATIARRSAPARPRCSTGRRSTTSCVPAQAEPVAAVGDDNVELQLVVANAAYRLGQGRSKDKAATMKALEEAAAGYLTVLKNNTWHTEAAFNYEYIVRLRDELAKSGKQPPQPPKDQTEESDNGESGAPSPATTSKGFQIYIPLGAGREESVRRRGRQGGAQGTQGADADSLPTIDLEIVQVRVAGLSLAARDSGGAAGRLGLARRTPTGECSTAGRAARDARRPAIRAGR